MFFSQKNSNTKNKNEIECFLASEKICKVYPELISSQSESWCQAECWHCINVGLEILCKERDIKFVLQLPELSADKSQFKIKIKFRVQVQSSLDTIQQHLCDYIIFSLCYRKEVEKIKSEQEKVARLSQIMSDIIAIKEDGLDTPLSPEQQILTYNTAQRELYTAKQEIENVKKLLKNNSLKSKLLHCFSDINESDFHGEQKLLKIEGAREVTGTRECERLSVG